MNKIGAVYKREMYSYLLSPLAYVITGAFILLSGWFFSSAFLNTGLPQMQPFFGQATLLLLFLAPILTMRLLADEMRHGTYELLLTNPLTSAQIVLGKYFAALTVFLGMVVLTLIYPAILFVYGDPHWGTLLSGYLGFFLFGAALIAIGLFGSSLTAHQLIAAMASFAIILLFYLLSSLSNVVGGTLGEVLREATLLEHFDTFQRGIIDTYHLAYYVVLTLIFLILTVHSLNQRTW